MSQPEKPCYEFGPFRLDVRARLLLRGAELVPLTPKAFDTLLALVERHGELVERHALIKAVWPAVHVVESNLNSNIFTLRRALGDYEGKAYIVTVARRGYRFVAPVRRVTPSGDDKLSACGQALGKNRPVNAAAYQLYLQGHACWQQRTAESLQQAIAYFSRAVALAPDFAAAHVGLAHAYALLGCVHSACAPREAMPQALAAARRALELDETLPDAHTALGLAQALYEWDWAASEQAFQRALELNPLHATAQHWYGLHLAWQGRTEEALRALRSARQLDPFSPIISANVGWAYYAARRYAEAIAECCKTIATAPHFYRAYVYLGWAYLQTGAATAALDALERAQALHGGGPEVTGIGHAYAQVGQPAEARRVLAGLAARATTSYVSPYASALIHAGLGEADAACAALEQAYAERTHWLVFLDVEPRFDALRADLRWADLLQRIGLAPAGAACSNH